MIPGGYSLNEEPPRWRIGRWNLLMPYTITIVLFQKTLEKKEGAALRGKNRPLDKVYENIERYN
jgi:hypothetical protein